MTRPGWCARIAVASLMTLICTDALAQPMPRLVPARDVDIVYRLEGAAVQQIPGGAPDGVRLQWDAAGQRLRTQPIGAPVYAITDLRRRVAAVVFAAQSSILELPLRGGDPQTLIAGADARYIRRGNSHALGQDCTEWSITSRHLDVTGCVAADGVVLRAEGLFNGQPGSAVALSVVRGPIPLASFVPPPNFFRLPFGMPP